jgi:hypothetical protein
MIDYTERALRQRNAFSKIFNQTDVRSVDNIKATYYEHKTLPIKAHLFFVYGEETKDKIKPVIGIEARIEPKRNIEQNMVKTVGKEINSLGEKYLIRD